MHLPLGLHPVSHVRLGLVHLQERLFAVYARKEIMLQLLGCQTVLLVFPVPLPLMLGLHPVSYAHLGLVHLQELRYVLNVLQGAIQ